MRSQWEFIYKVNTSKKCSQYDITERERKSVSFVHAYIQTDGGRQNKYNLNSTEQYIVQYIKTCEQTDKKIMETDSIVSNIEGQTNRHKQTDTRTNENKFEYN